MDLKQFYLNSIYGDSLSEKVHKLRKDFFNKNPNSNFLTGKSLSFNQKNGMIRLLQNYKSLGTYIKDTKDVEIIQNMHQITEVGILFLNFNAFLSTIQMLGTPEQVNYWQNLIISFKILGSYAQTEMGHGSDIQGFLTRADYDTQTEQFILNTPTPRSGKYWPGILGVQCTHCVLQAQTYVQVNI